MSWLHGPFPCQHFKSSNITRKNSLRKELNGRASAKMASSRRTRKSKVGSKHHKSLLSLLSCLPVRAGTQKPVTDQKICCKIATMSLCHQVSMLVGYLDPRPASQSFSEHVFRNHLTNGFVLSVLYPVSAKKGSYLVSTKKARFFLVLGPL